MSWLKNMFGKQKRGNDDILQKYNAQMAEIKSTGKIDDGHYTDSVEKIKEA